MSKKHNRKSVRLRRRREELWRKNPHCYWCGQLTVLPPYAAKLKDVPDNMATIDHLRPRHHPDRREPVQQGEGSRYVLACRKCNNDRDRETLLTIPIEVRREWANEGKERKKNRNLEI